MSEWGVSMYVVVYGCLPEPFLLGKQQYPCHFHNLAPPLATSKKSSDVFGCSVQIVLVRTDCQRLRCVSLLIKESTLPVCGISLFPY